MNRFIVRRSIEILVVLAIVSLVIYALIGLMPGDPVDLMIASNPHLTVADAARLKALYGLDKPLFERYAAWAAAALHGDFGYSRLYAQPVLTVLLPRLGNTALLMGTSFALTLALAWPIGLMAARRPGSWSDDAANFASFATISMPSFWLALMLILVFAVQLGWLPPGGATTIRDATGADHLVLPVITLTLVNFGPQLRYMRAAMIDTLNHDYIRTARAKGAGEARVLTRHALRNALIPLITVVALSFGSLFSGALITETMFSYPGMGKLIYDAVLGNDYNLALAGLLFATLMTLLANFAADLAYAAIDPRIAYQ